MDEMNLYAWVEKMQKDLNEFRDFWQGTNYLLKMCTASWEEQFQRWQKGKDAVNSLAEGEG